MTKEQKQLGKTLWASIAEMARQQNDKLKAEGMAQGLLKEGIFIEVISRTTDLSI